VAAAAVAAGRCSKLWELKRRRKKEEGMSFLKVPPKLSYAATRAHYNHAAASAARMHDGRSNVFICCCTEQAGDRSRLYDVCMVLKQWNSQSML
jgi:hypothetical protein